MYSLVNLDNVPDGVRKNGLRGMVDRFAELAIPRNTDPGYLRLDVKLYGGWFEKDTPTKAAQDLTAGVQREYPRKLYDTKSMPARKITVNACLAYALESLPKKTITNTFRWRSPSRKMMCSAPVRSGCTAQDCPLGPVVGFVNKNLCPEGGCPVTPNHIFKNAGQQKLVDTTMEVQA